jgi:hypothetical protein
MWLPPVLSVQRTVREHTLADVLERVLNNGVIVDGDGHGSSGSRLSARDLIKADVPILGTRTITPSVAGRRTRNMTRRKFRRGN